MPVGDFVHCRGLPRKARDVFVEVETPWSEAKRAVATVFDVKMFPKDIRVLEKESLS